MPVHQSSAPHTHDSTATTIHPVHYLSPRRVMAVLIGLAIIVWAVVAVVASSDSSGSRPSSTTNLWQAPGQPIDGTQVGPSDTVAPTGPVAVDSQGAPEPQPQPEPHPQPQPEPQPQPDPTPDTLPEAQPEPQPDPDPSVPAGPDQLAPQPQPTPEPCYQACIAPVELEPIEVPTPVQPGNLSLSAGEAGGCSAECITFAQAWVWPGTSDIEVEVTTHTAAFIKVYVRTDAPGTKPDGRPYYPGSPTVATTGDLDTWFSATLRGLDEETKYWILVEATDPKVRSSHAVGIAVTPQLFDDVQLAFAGIDIIYDGDKGNNKGELTFDWNVGDFEVGRNGEYHRGDGSRIDLATQPNSYAQQNLGGKALPPLTVTGLERDPKGIGFCRGGDHRDGVGTNNSCGYAWNTTDPGVFTIDDIEAMAECDMFDIDERYDGWKCTRITTSESHSGIPEFSVVVAFRVY